jgi:hypothetical protein
MKNFKLYIVSGLFLASGAINAQVKDTPFEKDLFKDKKDEFKVARSAYNDGKDKFDAGMEAENQGGSSYKFFTEAIPLFEKADDFNPNYSMLNYMLGLCYLNTEKKFLALDYLVKARELNATVTPYIDYNVVSGIKPSIIMKNSAPR